MGEDLGVGDRALPHGEDVPSSLLQLPFHSPVSAHVAFEFARPEIDAGFWRVTEFAAGVSMPKTAVHKDGGPVLRQDNVWLPWQEQASVPSKSKPKPMKC